MQIDEKVKKLIDKGAAIPQPHAVEIGADVDMARIAGKGVVLYAGTRIHGAKTLVGPGSKIGYEAPATLVDCRLGRDVELRGGFFKDSLFLDRVSIGSGAQVRDGCILEEQSGGNHAIGLKQTILFPFVTLGSLINFCDCFMAGGTDRKNHSEVGSSFIHFNFTPNQDKATPSLLGDVPRGVMLDQPPIFLGGQGGLVGPVRLGFGIVTAAGTILRRDCLENNRLLSGVPDNPEERMFGPGVYQGIRRRVVNNIYYLANLLALKEWYVHIRHQFFEQQAFGAALAQASSELLQQATEERLKRFRELADKMQCSIAALDKSPDSKAFILEQQREFMCRWPDLESCFKSGSEERVGVSGRDTFITGLREAKNKTEQDYLAVIRDLSPDLKNKGTAWLQAIVDHITNKAMEVIPSFK